MNDSLASVIEADRQKDEVKASAPSIPVLIELTKPRLAMLSTLTAMAGFGLAPTPFLLGPFLVVTVGVFLSACGALALNQFIERETDALMDRTRNRPLPTGRLRPRTALVFGSTLVATGVGVLTLLATLSSGLLAALTVYTYLGMYTPLKRRSTWCTHFGALPGALPPWIGWAGSGAAWDPNALFLFLILFVWQMPHFYAIARMCDQDYARAGIRVLRIQPGRIDRLRLETLFYCAVLVVAVVAIFALDEGGWLFLTVSGFAAVWQLSLAVRFSIKPGQTEARKLFFATLLFLPAVLLSWLFNHGG